MGFRTLPKELLAVKVPTDLAGTVRELAATNRLTLSAMTTLILCKGLGRDPRGYALVPIDRPRRGKGE